MTPQEILDLAKQEAAYINNEKDEYLKNETTAANEANITARALSGQLLLVAGAILTFSSAIISSQNTLSNLSYGWRGVLIGAWVLLALSAVAGMCQVLIDFKFFIKWRKYNHSVAEELVTGKYVSTNINEALKKYVKPPESSISSAMILQGFFLGLGIALFIVVISHALLVAKV